MTATAATQLSPRARRHGAPTMALARTMYGDGDAWTCVQIARYLTGQTGVRIHHSTVRVWVDDEYRDRRLAAKRARVKAAKEERARLATASLRCEHCGASAALVATDTLRRRGRKPSHIKDWSAATRARLLSRGLELRERGVSYRGISEVFAVYENATIDPDVLRYWLVSNGAKRDSAKARRTRAQMERSQS